MRYLVVLMLALMACVSPTYAASVGFDLDDTLGFTSPAFSQGFASGEKPFSPEFWHVVNASDAGRSTIKPSVVAILRAHLAAGDDVYIITARAAVNTQPVQDWASTTFGIPAERVLFASPKSELIKSLGITVFYGDADTDITDAIAAGAKPVRVQRSPLSSYEDKYNPGIYGEEVLLGTE